MKKTGIHILILVALLFVSLSTTIKADTINSYVVSGDMSGTYNTLSEATTALNGDSGSTYVITLMESDLSMSGTSTIVTGKTVTLRSDGTDALVIRKITNQRHITCYGKLILENIVLDGNGYTGGVLVADGELIMNSGVAIINNNSLGDAVTGNLGGGVKLTNSTFTMNAGLIDNNKGNRGGGVDVGTSSTFTMNGGKISNNEAGVHGGGGVGIYVLGTFTMNGGELSHNTSQSYGGGAYAAQATHVSTEPTDWCRIIINNGRIYGNTAYYGGGLSAQYNGNITMNNGEIFNNHAISYGGGVLVNNSIYEDDGVFFKFNDGKIYENTTQGYGGGILVMDSAKYTASVYIGNPNTNVEPLIYSNESEAIGGGGLMLVSNYSNTNATIYNAHFYDNHANNGVGGAITVHKGGNLTIFNALIGGDTSAQGNTANDGGGIASIYGIGQISIHDVQIKNNKANNNGGGIFLEKEETLSISGKSYILNNKAENQGGGIYTGDVSDYDNLTINDYQNIITSTPISFAGNQANGSYLPPVMASNYLNIKYDTSSLVNNATYLNPINNYDINYVTNNALEYYLVNYDANGGEGNFESTEIVGSPYTILNLEETGISKEGYTFLGWSLTPLGAVEYSGGDSLHETMEANESISFYAQWKENKESVITEEKSTITKEEPTSKVNEKSSSLLQTGDSQSYLGFAFLLLGAIIILLAQIKNRNS